jgi:hypothetical protein
MGLWPSYFNPYTGTIQMWLSPRAVGVQQPHLCPQDMLAGALPYGPPQQVRLPFTLPLMPLPIHPPWSAIGSCASSSGGMVPMGRACGINSR